jgi:outer membrane protein insertion porin family
VSFKNLFTRKFGALLFVFGGLTSAYGQSSFEGKTVRDIQVEGLARIEKDAVIAKIKTQKGQPLSSATVRTDIEALYRMGYFDEIEFESAGPADGLTIKVKLKERPVISKLEFEGNERISTNDLKEVIKLKEWAILDVNKVREDVALLQKHYEDKGFYLAKVRYDIKPVKAGEVRLVYKIDDYEKVQVKQITFLNNKVFSETELKGLFMETKEGGFFSFLSGGGSFKESSFKMDLQRMLYWYLDHGYLKFRYDSPVVTVSEDKRWIYISVYVDEGEAYSMGKTSFSGDLLFSSTELEKNLKQTPGKTFKISERNLDIQSLTEKYQDLGYAFVNVIPKMNTNDEQKIVDIDYSFEKGSLVSFGEINIVGNTKTYDKVIRRELRVYEGELFSGSRLRISRERVERLGYFAPGEVQINQLTRKGREDVLDLEISVKERSTGTVNIGAGYSSASSFFFQGQISEINFLGKGQTLSFQTQYGGDPNFRSFSFEFLDPYAFDTRWSGGFDLYWTVFPIFRRYSTRRFGAALKSGYMLEDDLNFYVTYKLEGLKRVNYDTPPGYIADDTLDKGILSSTTFSIVRDKRNNRFETTAGNYQSASLEMAGLGGDKFFHKTVLNNRLYIPLFGDLVFRNNFEIGHIGALGSRGIPPSERFYLGGPTNLRGYEFFGLSPEVVRSTNPDGTPATREVVGGTTQVFTMLELEHPLIREAGLKFVTFLDLGNSFLNTPFIDQPFNLRANAGFGFRWFSPLGPLRFEFGYPIGRKPTEAASQFYFFVGQPF